MTKVKIKTGTLTQIDSAKNANQLNQAELYLASDKKRLLVGDSANSYIEIAKSSEVGDYSLSFSLADGILTSDDITKYSFGINSGELLVAGTSTNNAATTSTVELTTPIALSGNKVVLLENGVLAYANTTSSSQILGFTQGAASANANVIIQNSGELDGFFGLTIGQYVYLSDNGTITQTVPTSGRLQNLGVATSSTKVFIKISPPLFLANSQSVTYEAYITTQKSIRLGSGTYSIDTANIDRGHNWGVGGSFINASSANPATFNTGTGVGTQTTLNPDAIFTAGNGGAYGIVRDSSDRIVMTSLPNYYAVDGSSKCREQINSFYIEPDLDYKWTLDFKIGSDSVAWTNLTNDVDPVNIWQIKPSVGSPTLFIILDTDTLDSTKLVLKVYRRNDADTQNVVIGTVSGLLRNTTISVEIFAKLDERTTGGSGYVKAVVNGNTVTDLICPTLRSDMTTPVHWCICMYRYYAIPPNAIHRQLSFGTAKLEKLLTT